MEQTRTKSLRGSLLLTLTSLIWGIAFVAQSEGMNYVGPLTFNGVRMLIGGMVLIPCILALKKWNGAETEAVSAAERKEKRKWNLCAGLVCGILLFTSSTVQQCGIAETSVGKAGFITSLYIVLVPIMGLFMKKKTGKMVWISVVIAAVGMYLLCITESFTICRGDVLMFACAVVFSFHIMAVDYFSPKTDGLVLSCIQFWVVGLISLVLMFVFEHPTWESLTAAAVPVLYAGVLSCGVAYTLQVVAQKDVEPTTASLLMSLESVFSLIAGWILLGERLSGKELIGCALVFGAIVLAQLPTKES